MKHVKRFGWPLLVIAGLLVLEAVLDSLPGGGP